ncbi:MAG: L-asparaginase [Pseudonocardia sp.]|jgi:L-asparaginase|nr:L-asparaginase [Pseudonocardia sp.]
MTRTVSLLAMGGTISTEPTAAGPQPNLKADQLTQGVSLPCAVRPRDVRTMSSRAITPTDVWELAGVVREEIEGGAAGVVITHGTDTMEETAYALSMLIGTPVPVVLTGAMRATHLAGPDGHANLAAAVAVAAHQDVARYGPVIVFQDEIHVARLVTKTHSTRVAAFTSPAAGPVGYVAEDAVELLLGPPPGTDRLPMIAHPAKRVDLVWAAMGAGHEIVDAVAADVDGLVVAANGGGHLSPVFTESVTRIVRSGRPVVLASRCADGPQLRRTYAGTGSETQLLEAGLIPAGILSPVKARLRLLFGLSAGLSETELFAPATSPSGSAQ